MKTSLPLLAIMAVITLLFAGCLHGGANVTPNTKAHYTATNPNDVEILRTKPDKPYTEIGTVEARFYVGQTAKMNDAIRAKAARLGADAVIITSEGESGAYSQFAYATGVAIKYKQ